MARKKEQTNNISSDNLISDLIEGTEFNFIGQNDEQGKGSLTDKPKVETPIYALNCLLGGGLPLGAIIEVYGPNAAGKSSLMYETLGNFQKQYSDGVAFIIDSEASTDDTRLKALGVDTLRTPRMGANTLEEGFEQIIKILKKMVDNPNYKGFPVMILWDELLKLCPTTV
jgi:RecA/RadA recombinase